MNLPLATLLMALFGALLMGLAKGGLSGLGNLTVSIFANCFDAKASVGILLPVLVLADIVAVIVYRKHAEWKYVWRLLPWMLVGVLVGWLALDFIDNKAMRPLIGAILLSMTALHFYRVWQTRRTPDNAALLAIPHSLWFRMVTGIFGGFATMVANAAGPVATLYFFAVGLPKMAFIGTGAWTFFILNLVKVPFSIQQGLITADSLKLSLTLAPAAILGALVAPKIVKYIPQKLFETITWIFVVIGAVRLFF
ncbi:MAG: sulfite exporter TauE/SafE family protein [Verrucomicrobiota bacterium]|nr:sulfite exporter TauE/SafE family protein [Verrucomicrobiota bacterium]